MKLWCQVFKFQNISDFRELQLKIQGKHASNNNCDDDKVHHIQSWGGGTYYQVI